MNFTVDRDVLEGLLARVQAVAERRHTMAVLSHTLVTAGGDALSLVASDLDIVIRCTQGVPGAGAGSIALPARRLYEVAKVLPKGPVALVERDGNYVEISAGRAHFRVAGLPAGDFPEMPQRPAAGAASAEAAAFRRQVDRVSPFASLEETRLNLTGVLLERVESEDGRELLRMVASDGHRLAVADGELRGAGALLGGGRLLVPRKGLLEIRRLADAGAGSVELSATDKFLFAAKGDTELWVRLLDADFPDYRVVLPRAVERRALLSRDRFAESLRRVSVMAPEKVHSVRLAFSGGQLEVFASFPDVGEARDLLEVEYEGAPITIGFNGRYLLDAVNGVSDENLVMEMKDEVSQVSVRPEKDGSFQAVIMPMRIY